MNYPIQEEPFRIVLSPGNLVPRTVLEIEDNADRMHSAKTSVVYFKNRRYPVYQALVFGAGHFPYLHSLGPASD